MTKKRQEKIDTVLNLLSKADEPMSPPQIFKDLGGKEGPMSEMTVYVILKSVSGIQRTKVNGMFAYYIGESQEAPRDPKVSLNDNERKVATAYGDATSFDPEVLEMKARSVSGYVGRLIQKGVLVKLAKDEYELTDLGREAVA